MKTTCKNLIGTTRLLVIVLLATVATMQSCRTDTGYQKELAAVAQEINKKLPMNIGTGITWTKTEALPGKIFRYTYTLANQEVANIDSTAVKKEQTPIVLETIKNEPSLKSFRDHNVIMQYDYYDKDGKRAFSINITPEMYKTQK